MSVVEGYDDALGRLTRAAIDAYMVEQDWMVRDTYYDTTGPGPQGQRVERPGADGYGGGKWYMDPSQFVLVPGASQDSYKSYAEPATAQFQQAFAQVRGNVSTIVSRWRDLPEPSSLDSIGKSAADQLRDYSTNVYSDLSQGAENEKSVIRGNGPMAVPLDAIRENMNGLRGNMVTAFRNNVLRKLSYAIAGQYGIATVRGGSIGSMKKLWMTTRPEVPKIMNATADALEQIRMPGDRGTTVSINLSIVGSIVEGVTLFVPGADAALKALKGIGIGLKLLTEVNGGKDLQLGSKPQASSTELLSDLSERLTKLSGEIARAEQLTYAFLNDNLNAVQEDRARNKKLKPNDLDTNRSTFDLIMPTFDPNADIAIDPQLTEEIIEVQLPSISTSLGKLATESYDVDFGFTLARDPSIGMGTYGPTEKMRELNGQLRSLANELSTETIQAARDFANAIDEMKSVEDANIRKLKELLSDFPRR